MLQEVSREVVIDDGPAAGPGRHTALRMVWRPGDPFAVVLRLTAYPEHPALPRGEWVVARDVLTEGLTEPAGDGVVKVRHDPQRDRVWFDLQRLGRPACVSVPREEVAAFLAQTERLVPSGAEQSDAAVDALLADVLGR